MQGLSRGGEGGEEATIICDPASELGVGSSRTKREKVLYGMKKYLNVIRSKKSLLFNGWAKRYLPGEEPTGVRKGRVYQAINTTISSPNHSSQMTGGRWCFMRRHP